MTFDLGIWHAIWTLSKSGSKFKVTGQSSRSHEDTYATKTVSEA